MQFLTTMHSVQQSEFALQPLTDTKPSQKPGEAPEHNSKFNQLSFVRTIQQFEKHNQFPEQIKKQVETPTSLDKKHHQTAQERQYALKATCEKCHQLYKNDVAVLKHQKTKECTIGQFIFSWINGAANVQQILDAQGSTEFNLLSTLGNRSTSSQIISQLEDFSTKGF